MNNLNETLTQIIEKIKSYRSFYEQNEMAVRDQIINPILNSLGWNTANPADVQPNMPTDEGIPDYSLIKDGKIILFIEAKKMSVDVEQKEIIRQLAKYSFNEGTKYGVLTNGIVWMLIRSFEEGTKLHERIVWKTNIENEDPSKVIRKITTISKANIEDIDALVKKILILDEIWQSLLDKPEEMVTGLSIVAESIISQSQNYSNYQFDNSEIEDFLKEKVKELISGQFGNKNGVQSETIVESVRKNVLRTVRKNVLPPDKTMCRFSYNNVLYNATIMNRQLQVEKVGTFSSFSGASVEITNTSRNGWLDWEIRLPSDSKWQLSDTWRKSNVNL